jgi:DNA-binding MarR family transcriptional regulator
MNNAMDETPDLAESAQEAQESIAAPERDSGVSRGKLADLLGYHLRRAEVLAFQQFIRAMAPFEVSPAQLGVLLIVSANPGINQTRAGRALGIDRSTLVSIIDSLEERELLERTPSPTDRRSHALVLTARGKQFIERLTPTLDAHEGELSRTLSDEERRTLIDLLDRVVSAHRHR